MGSFSTLCNISDVKILQKAAAPTVFIQFQLNFMRNMLLIGEYRLLFFCDLLKKIWRFEFLVNTGPSRYEAGNFKTLLFLQFSSDFRQT